jgi:hypothetical protein
MNRSSYTNEDLYGERSWTYLEVLFKPLFPLTELFIMAIVGNFEVILRQTLNHNVYNSVILRSAIPL